MEAFCKANGWCNEVHCCKCTVGIFTLGICFSTELCMYAKRLYEGWGFRLSKTVLICPSDHQNPSLDSTEWTATHHLKTCSFRFNNSTKMLVSQLVLTSFEQDKHYHLSRELALWANQVLKCSTVTHKTLPSTLLHACAINLFRPGIANKRLSIAANWAQRTMVIFFQHKIIIFCISACFKNTFFKERVPFSLH